eukprot:CAMPEP_0174251766 /NCGR_PEP_ID=MMETSP0439-20130205/1488_1 /TAXON_ID=0 /ORGANISM="Stereomyxa ramosa, Strain Chinc5" /LENGTH=60 /DNA_ID=CAMNT_0015332175 /DNA_START=665 /DNA_END=843 /DNA_ORIENTATION=+
MHCINATPNKVYSFRAQVEEPMRYGADDAQEAWDNEVDYYDDYDYYEEEFDYNYDYNHNR